MQNHPIKLSGERDELFNTDHYPKPFAFNHEVAQVFDDMVHRSVPLYQEVTSLAVDWALRYACKDGKVFDIGCSTGTVLECLGRRLVEPTHFVGVDCSGPMIKRAQEKLADFPQHHSLELKEADVREVDFGGASVIIVNYTLQFLPVRDRMKVLKKMIEGLKTGGLIFMSEKVRSESYEFQETTTSLYEGFKRSRGYSMLEIEKKKEALENVLVPLTESDYRRQMKKFGIEAVDSISKWNNFVTLVGQKG